MVNMVAMMEQLAKEDNQGEKHHTHQYPRNSVEN
jgi:hypothetical protein